MTLKVIHRLQTFLNAIHRTFVWHFTRFQLTVYSHGSSALAELLVIFGLGSAPNHAEKLTTLPLTPDRPERESPSPFFAQLTPSTSHSQRLGLSPLTS